MSESSDQPPEYHITHGYFKVLRDTPRWSMLNRLGHSRLLKSSFIWLVVVPLLARLLAKVGPEHTLEIFGSEFTLSLGLPFSWKLFFYSSVCVALASTLYSLFCPAIVRDYDSYADFSAKGYGSRQIISHFEVVLPPWSRHREVIFRQFLESFTTSDHETRSVFLVTSIQAVTDPALRLRSQLASSTIEAKNEGDAFWFVRDLGDIRAWQARWACLTLYAAGLIMLLVVFLQNFLYVFRLT